MRRLDRFRKKYLLRKAQKKRDMSIVCMYISYFLGAQLRSHFSTDDQILHKNTLVKFGNGQIRVGKGECRGRYWKLLNRGENQYFWSPYAQY